MLQHDRALAEDALRPHARLSVVEELIRVAQEQRRAAQGGDAEDLRAYVNGAEPRAVALARELADAPLDERSGLLHQPAAHREHGELLDGAGAFRPDLLEARADRLDAIQVRLDAARRAPIAAELRVIEKQRDTEALRQLIAKMEEAADAPRPDAEAALAVQRRRSDALTARADARERAAARCGCARVRDRPAHARARSQARVPGDAVPRELLDLEAELAPSGLAAVEALARAHASGEIGGRNRWLRGDRPSGFVLERLNAEAALAELKKVNEIRGVRAQRGAS